MIMVDVYFPVVDLVYNLKVDENSKINALVKEISEMMCKKYKSTFDKSQEQYMLCSLDKKEILSGQETLSHYQIKNGGRLMLV